MQEEVRVEEKNGDEKRRGKGKARRDEGDGVKVLIWVGTATLIMEEARVTAAGKME